MKRIVFYCILMNLISYACSNEATSYWSQGGPSAQDGWDIFTGSGYRYGPSIIINDDGSIDAWFAAPGDYHHGESAITYGDAAKEAQQLGGRTFAQYFESGKEFVSLGIYCPNWNSASESMLLSLYRWNTDYATTVAANPVHTERFNNYGDNSWLQIPAPGQTGETVKLPAGKYLWTLSDGTANAGIWKSTGSESPASAVSYIDGTRVEGQFCSRVYYTKASGNLYWDQITYQHSTDGGKTWSAEEITLKPTDYSRDALSCCDPGVARWGDYYYLGYTSTEDHLVNNHLYVARSKNPNGPWEKWNGSSWGGDKPEPIVTYTGNPKKFGAGEPSIVVLNGLVYLYYSWNDTEPTTRLATVSAEDPDWPAHLNQQGTVISKGNISGADHCDVKYRNDIRKFYAVHTAGRMSENSYIMFYESSDGIHFQGKGMLEGAFCKGLHNCGISGDESGHIDVRNPQWVSYAYGIDSWGEWTTRWSPLKWE